MKKVFFIFLVAAISTVIFSQEIPKQINYQGVIKTAAGQNAADGNYQITFKIYNEETGGTAIWTETQSITLSGGIFSALLGSVTPLTPVAFDRQQYLGITVASEAELTPRTLLTPSPYSFMSLNVADNIITTGKIQDGAVTAAKVATNEVVKSVNGLKDNVNLVAGSNVTLTPSGNNITIAAQTSGTGGGTVTSVGTGGGLTGGPITASGTISIANLGVTEAMLAGSAVTSAKIADGAVLTADLADNSVTSAKIVNGTITESDMAANSVTAPKILDEPGYNYKNTGDANALYPLTAAGQSFVSVTLDAPAAGFALVTGTAMVFITHTNGTMDNIILKLSKTAGDIGTPAYGLTVVRVPAANPTSAANHIVNAVNFSMIFPVTAGANTFHLNAYRSLGASSSLLSPEITALYLPTRYGTGSENSDKIPPVSGINNFVGE
jgi:hypothetical protein